MSEPFAVSIVALIREILMRDDTDTVRVVAINTCCDMIVRTDILGNWDEIIDALEDAEHALGPHASVVTSLAIAHVATEKADRLRDIRVVLIPCNDVSEEYEGHPS